MLLCSQCREEVATETAILSDDFDFTPIQFCSVVCQYTWTTRILMALIERRIAQAANCQQN